MNRRDFVKLITAASIGAFTMDPDKLLWVPGEKTIFIPPERRLIYASEVAGHEWHSFGIAVGECDVLEKFLYEYKEGPAYKDRGMLFKHVEIYEVVKGLHYNPS